MSVQSARRRRSEMHPKPLLDSESLLAAMDEHKVEHQHAWNVWRRLIRSKYDGGDAVKDGSGDRCNTPDIPKAFRNLIGRDFAACTSKIVTTTTSASEAAPTHLLYRSINQSINQPPEINS
eukprot:GHVU01130242.1.p2 GENE.GHVU01130242.1~~GHVU01130242.1.p2  ORF type:complete len:121 (-),score=12.88 GHVU01130242.1:276-638(-)